MLFVITQTYFVFELNKNYKNPSSFQLKMYILLIGIINEFYHFWICKPILEMNDTWIRPLVSINLLCCCAMLYYLRNLVVVSLNPAEIYQILNFIKKIIPKL